MRGVQSLPGTLGHPTMLDQIIEHHSERQTFLAASQQAMPECNQQRWIEGLVLRLQVQSQPPAQIVLNSFGRRTISHAQHELQDQDAKQTYGIPRRTSVVVAIQRFQ